MHKLRYLISMLVISGSFLPGLVAASSIYSLDSSQEVTQPTLPPKTVVLTFDDGPSSYTPQILNVLREKQVKATFFVVGKEALARDGLKRIYDEGHEVGNHTYTHAAMSIMSDWRFQLELNVTRQIIESQTHHSTRIFRPPYLGSDALAPDSYGVIVKAGQLGYVTVGEDIDSSDWKRPGAGEIWDRATTGAGGIILFHDGGGDRGQTVEALPRVIDHYKEQGYKFMTVSEALGLSREQLMPSLSTTDKVLAGLAGVVFGAYGLAGQSLHWLILALIIVSFGRMALVMLAAVVQSRRRYPELPEKVPACSVLVPAHNEAAVIQSCLRSVLASDYKLFEVIVIDDGSTDNTVALAEAFKDPRLIVVTKPNGGKASALNYGIELARGQYIVAIDADTVFRPDTLQQLMRHFQDPAVGAVSGNTRIANRHKLITKLQSLEYIVGFNLDRRMGDLFDCITVVPGAVGAFRKPVLLKVGGFRFDTLAEDTDLTLAIKRLGHRIVYDATAVAYTEAPSTVSDLLKQRFRWTFGTMQAVWKHKKAFLNPRYGTLGLIGLPYLVFFQIIFPLVSPLFDLAVVVGLYRHDYSFILSSFVVYTAADVLMCGMALKLDGEKLHHLWLIIPQRIVYRQLMYYVIIKSAVNVLKGNLVGWGKLKREGKHLAEANQAT